MNPRVFKRRYLRAHGVSAHYNGTDHHLGTSDNSLVAAKLEAKRKKKRAMAKASRRTNR